MPSKWSSAFWRDLAERVGSVALYGFITALTTVNVSDLDWDQAWAIIVLPAILSLAKGLLANMASPESGASLLKAPPGPVLEEEVPAVPAQPDVASKSFESSHKKPGEGGVINWLLVIGIAVVVIALILLFSVIDVNKDKDNDGKRGLDWERSTSAMVLR